MAGNNGGGRRPNLPEMRAINGKPTQAVIPIGNVKVSPLRVPPKPPSWMKSKWALEEWDEVAPVMVENKLLTKANVKMFALMIAAYGKIIEGYTTRKNGGLNTTLLAQYRMIVNDFGLLPCSQIRARVPEGAGAETNPFLKNKKAA